MPTTYTGPRTSYYDVSGSLADVVTFIEAQQEAGRAEWRPVYQYQQEDGTVTSVTIDCELVIELPRWTEYASGSPEDRAEWDRFMEALQRHEQGHIDIAQQHLDGADQWMVGHPDTEAEARWQEGLARLQAESDGYDADTGHGVYYGCSITVSDSGDSTSSTW